MISARRTTLAALVLVLAAAGCGGSGSSSGTNASPPPPPGTDAAPSDMLSAAASATTDAGTYKTTFELAMDGPNGPVTLAGGGEFQADPPLGKMTMDFSAITGAAGGEAMVIFDGTTMYMQIPGLGVGTDKWFKFDTEALGAAAGLGQLSQVAQGDPSQTLQYLSGATDVEVAGTETVRDVETTKYTMTIDLNAAAEQAESEELKQAILDSIAENGVSEVPAEVWIDGDGLVRKTVTHFNDVTTDEGTTDMTVTVEIYDFGEDVEIEVPSEDDVLDFGNLGGLVPTITMPVSQ
jgi:hypothetical protein